jgi:DNA-binding MarR family transcriptional regulator
VSRGRRWKLQDEVEQSGLHPMTRYVLHTLLHKADARTGIIPAEWQPTFTELERRTGMRRQDVGSALSDAEKQGWLHRIRGGGKGNPTQYTIKLPTEPDPF